mmetsp:Transcript_37437/g.105691  ORF Transcript_37437/g.105691 Transcript_37437/m.105691 type:complete len:220 (+) Transcript_37437:4119-4778(+)
MLDAARLQPPLGFLQRLNRDRLGLVLDVVGGQQGLKMPLQLRGQLVSGDLRDWPEANAKHFLHIEGHRLYWSLPELPFCTRQVGKHVFAWQRNLDFRALRRLGSCRCCWRAVTLLPSLPASICRCAPVVLAWRIRFPLQFLHLAKHLSGRVGGQLHVLHQRRPQLPQDDRPLDRHGSLKGALDCVFLQPGLQNDTPYRRALPGQICWSKGCIGAIERPG